MMCPATTVAAPTAARASELHAGSARLAELLPRRPLSGRYSHDPATVSTDVATIYPAHILSAADATSTAADAAARLLLATVS